MHDELRRKGGHLLAISSDAPDDAGRMRRENDLAFPVLCDPECVAIRAHGLLHEGGHPHGGDMAVPAHVLVDRDGRVAWSRVARRIQDRPDPLDVLVLVSRLR